MYVLGNYIIFGQDRGKDITYIHFPTNNEGFGLWPEGYEGWDAERTFFRIERSQKE